jgi:hypothetical protein
MSDPTIAQAAGHARRRARRHLETELDRLCTRNGLDAWDAWRRPRRLEALARVTRLSAETRDAIEAAGHAAAEGCALFGRAIQTAFGEVYR